MRKFLDASLSILLSLSFAASLAACTPGGTEETGTGNPSDTSAASGIGSESTAEATETLPQTPEDGIAIRVGETEISLALYRFLFAEYKASFLSAVGEDDRAAFWQKDAGGESYADYFKNNLTRLLAEQCAANERFAEMKLSLSPSEKARIDEALSREDVSSLLSDYEITKDELRLAIELPYRYEAVKAALFSDPSSARFSEHFRTHYALIRLIIIRTADKDIYDEEGNVTGAAALSEEERAEKAARIEKLKTTLSAKNFTEMMRKYSDDLYSAGYESGFFLYDGDAYTDAFLDFVFSLDTGKIGTLTEDHAVSFIERLALPKDAYRDPYYASSFTHFYENARKDLLREELSADIARAQIKNTDDIDVLNTPSGTYGIIG